MRSTLIFVLAGTVLLVFAGCGQSKAPDSPKPPVESKTTFEPPKLAGVDEEDQSASSKLMVVDNSAEEKKKLNKYLVDERMPTGSLRGACFVSYAPMEHKKGVMLPSDLPMTCDADSAIKNPEKGEVEQFECNTPRVPIRLGPWDNVKNRYGVLGAVICIEGVAVGKRSALGPSSFMVQARSRQFQVQSMDKRDAGNVGFMSVGGRVQFSNGEIFSCQIQMTQATSGKVVFNSPIAGYNDSNMPGNPFREDGGMASPDPVLSPPIQELGLYVTTCQRHAWLKAYLLVVDNPYVGISTIKSDIGIVSIDDVPPGKYTVAVWHPDFEPVVKSQSIEINPDKTTDILIEFKVPKILLNPPVLPQEAIQGWRVAGPFSNLDYDTVLPPEKGSLDFKTTYTGEEGKKVEWKYAEQKDGVVLQSSMVGNENFVYYAATILDSSKEQSVMFGGDMTTAPMKIWLNGQRIHTYRPAKNAEYFQGKLKQGKNILLVKSFNINKKSAFRITYLADGVKAGVSQADK